MGVYVFKSKHGPYIKIGHYSKSNAWSRIAHRGFRSCIHPKELRDKVMVHDMELVYWFPNRTTKDEKALHRTLKQYQVCGEWFSNEVVVLIPTLWNDENEHDSCSKEEACSIKRRL